MAHRERADIPADAPPSHSTARQNDAEEDLQTEPLLSLHVQPACAPSSHRLCTVCGCEEEDWTRSVEFAKTDRSGNETIVTGRALFDTGANLDNFLRLGFVKSRKIRFEHCIDVEGTRSPRWKRIWFRALGKRSQVTCYTADQRPITAVGVVENLRWRGIDAARCTSDLHFPQKFLDGRFLIVEDLAYDAIFSRKTMNDEGLRGLCNHTIAAIERPRPTEDSSAAKKSKDAKEEQRKIKQSQEQGKRDEKSRKKPAGDK